jgi:glycerophosphoryl diester phosphodiesterase
MNILSHRGYWKINAEKNTETAFARSFNLGYGTETDIRDSLGKLVVSHDMPLGNEITLQQFLKLLESDPLPLALNIKSDGLAAQLKTVMQHYPKHLWFVFDMSVPDMRAHLACGNPVYARVSEIEQEPVLFDQVQGIWLDAFKEDGWQIPRIKPWLEQGKNVCLVSSELHGRDHQLLWEKLRSSDITHHPRFTLCTDKPETAKNYFL